MEIPCCFPSKINKNVSVNLKKKPGAAFAPLEENSEKLRTKQEKIEASKTHQEEEVGSPTKFSTD